MINSKTIIAALLIACLYFSSCSSSYAPSPQEYNPARALYEKAGTLGKGNFEIAGSYTNSRIQDIGNKFEENIGLRLGYGFSKKLDLKLKYEHSGIPVVEYTTDTRLHIKRERDYFFSLVPKLNFKAEKILF